MTYKSPNVAGHEKALKNIIREFLATAQVDPKTCLHELVVYTMQRLPAGLERVDGWVMEPLLKEVVAEKIQAVRRVAKPLKPKTKPKKRIASRLSAAWKALTGNA